ncbi:MAG: exodeoxyribonuclease VII small subunit [Fibrobacter sp.]|nr:exodeoxyribonuclease VII small subunit [Fibrobacter sp.]
MGAKKKELTFEEALDNLEKIVDDLEEGKLKLEESLELFEKGIELSRFCQKKLEEAEGKIEILLKGQDGSISLKPYDSGLNDDEN